MNNVNATLVNEAVAWQTPVMELSSLRRKAVNRLGKQTEVFVEELSASP